MNEEIKIIIKAVTDSAKQAISEVNKELDEVKSSGKEAGQSIDSAMKSIGKGVAIAAAAITALTAAMANLGKSAQEIQKGMGKLNSSFISAGGTVKGATEQYKEFFGIIGDHDRTIETLQSLSRITIDTNSLNEYKDILAGIVSKYGEGYNTEAVAENIAETIASGALVGDLERVFMEAGISVEDFNNQLANTASLEERELLIRSTLNSSIGESGRSYAVLNQATIEYNESQGKLNVALSQAAAYTTPLLTALNNLGITMLTVFGPALQTISIYLTAFVQLIAEAVKWVGNLFSLMSSSDSGAAANMDGYNEAVKNYQAELQNYFSKTAGAVDGTINKVKELKKQTMGFDELNIVTDPSTSTPSGGSVGGGGGVGAMPTAPNLADFGIGGDLGLGDITKDIEKAKEKLKVILTIVGLIAAGFAAWKIASVVSVAIQGMKILMADGASFGKALLQLPQYLDGYYQGILGTFLMIAGAIAAILGYADAWVNGLDWGNFAAILGGLAAVVGGIALKFGGIATPIALLVSGIAMIVIGIKDLVQNGANAKNILMIVAGAIAAVTGALLLMGKANLAAIAGWIAHTAQLVAHGIAVAAVKVATIAMSVAQAALNLVMSLSPLTWIVLAIAAVIAAIVLLWNNCDAFREFWIKVWEGIKAGFQAVVDWFVSVINWLKNLFTKIGKFIKDNWKALLLFLVSPLAGIFKLLYDNCDGFREFIDNTIQKIKEFFVNLWNGIKEGAIAAWNGVVNAFKAAGTWFNDSVIKPISKFFTNMWEGFKNGAKKAWEGVKNIFSSVASFFSNIFTKAWEGVKKVFSTGGKIFNGIKEGIVNAFKSVVNAIITGINKVVKLPFEGLNAVLDKITGLKIAGLSPFKWLTWRAPVPQIPMLATGGIVNSATVAMIGERGKEAVLPLENNTGWMDSLADRIAQRQASPSKIVLMLDGKELGQATVKSINDLTKQTGKIPLVFA